MNKLRLSKVLMISTIILIAAFQCYWITRLYNEEWQSLKKETDVIFRDVVYKLQLERFRSDTTLFKKGIPDNLFVFNVIDSAKTRIIDSALSAQANWKERKVVVTIATDKHDSLQDGLIQRDIHSFN